MLADALPRIPLGHLPTPLQELTNLSRLLGGPRIYMKRDDLTGLATGGNKTRKLEFLLADALSEKADTIITVGAAQSNHARQTAAAAAKLGLRCVLVLSDVAPPSKNGNLLIDDLMGAQVRWTGGCDPYAVVNEVVDEERSVGRRPYAIPLGGSNPIGAAAYARAMDELMRQILERKLRIDHIVLATGSGGTQAGLVAGARALSFSGDIMGISVAKPAAQLSESILDLARRTALLLELSIEILPSNIMLLDDYLGEGYGVVTDAEREAIRLMARSEAVLVDPVYTGRALAGLIDLVRSKSLTTSDTVLFWHTGGAAALFAYADQVL